MNPLEEKLAAFVEDEVLFETVRGEILSHCDLNSLSLHEPVGELGTRAAAYLTARSILEDAFLDMGKYRRKPPHDTNKPNPAV